MNPMGTAKALLGTAIAAILGFNAAFLLLLSLMTCDLIAGFLLAILQRNVQSSKMADGVVKKLIIVMVVIAATAVGQNFGLLTKGLLASLPLGEPVVGWYCIKEVVSLLEIAEKSGNGYPRALQVILDRLAGAQERQMKDLGGE